MEAKKYTQMNNSHNKNISIITRFINVHFTKIFIFISIIFLIFQKEFIFIGGTTWDQIGYIRGAGKQIEKALLTLFDRSNPILQSFDYTEGRGVLISLPAHIFSRYEFMHNIFAALFKNNQNINVNNEIEVFYTLRHLFFTFYFVVINYFIIKKISKLTNVVYATLFYLFLCLTPSISGHSLFNNADIPYAFQFLLCAVFYIDYLDNKSKIFSTIPREYILGFLFGLNLVIRINAIVFLGSLSIFSLILLIKNNEVNRKFFFSELKIYLTALVILYILTPSMWLNPIDWINFAILDQFSHPNIVQTVVNGNKVSANETGLFYLVIWFFYKLPIIFLIFFLIYFFIFAYQKKGNIFSIYSLYFIFYVQIMFMILKPPAYDGLRHFLFVIPFFLALSSDLFDKYLNSNFFVGILLLVGGVLYLIYTQFGLGPYRYAYFNEFVDLENISYVCDETLNGCGNWATDYWGFSGKEMYKISKKHTLENNKSIYFCSPGETYTSFMEEKSPYKLTNGQPDFDDDLVWNQDEFIFSRLRFLDLLNKNKGKEFSIYAMTIHRPGNDNCYFNTFKNEEIEFSHKCNLVDSVSRKLRNKNIYFNYLYDCKISVN